MGNDDEQGIAGNGSAAAVMEQPPAGKHVKRLEAAVNSPKKPVFEDVYEAVKATLAGTVVAQARASNPIFEGIEAYFVEAKYDENTPKPDLDRRRADYIQEVAYQLAVAANGKLAKPGADPEAVKKAKGAMMNNAEELVSIVERAIERTMNPPAQAAAR